MLITPCQAVVLALENGITGQFNEDHKGRQSCYRHVHINGWYGEEFLVLLQISDLFAHVAFIYLALVITLYWGN